MAEDTLIVVAGMLAFVAIAIAVILYTFSDTVANPLRTFSLKNLIYDLLGPVHDGPVLSTLGLSNAPITVGHKTQVDGYDCSIVSNTHGKAMLMVQLKHKTTIHVVGIGSKSGYGKWLKRHQIKKLLGQLDLEGDFPDSIKLFFTKGRERDLIHIFDPADMIYFRDFCRAYDFEVYGDILYISQAGSAKDKLDETSLIADAKHFINRNEQLLSRL